MQSGDAFDGEIRAGVRALVDSSPPAPFLPVERSTLYHRRSRPRALALSIPLSLLIAGVAAASITALVRTGPGVDRLFLRTTSSGIAIRAYGSSSGVSE